MPISDQSLLPRFMLTVHNAYFQNDDFSEFTGRVPIEGELFRAVNDTKYAYLPLLGLLVIIETLGSIITDKNGIKNNMAAFFEMFMPAYVSHLDIFYNLRNTIVHNWDGGLKIDLDTDKSASSHLEMRNDRFVINIQKLYEDFVAGFRAMKEMSENDQVFAKAATTRLKGKVENADRKV